MATKESRFVSEDYQNMAYIWLIFDKKRLADGYGI